MTAALHLRAVDAEPEHLAAAGQLIQVRLRAAGLRQCGHAGLPRDDVVVHQREQPVRLPFAGVGRRRPGPGFGTCSPGLSSVELVA